MTSATQANGPAAPSPSQKGPKRSVRSSPVHSESRPHNGPHNEVRETWTRHPRPSHSSPKSSTRSSSGSPATPATACSSPATASPTSRGVRQRPRDAAELPGRDPGARGHDRRRLVVPGAHLRPRDLTPGDAPERAGRDEPRGAQGQPGRPAARARRSSSTSTRSTTATSTRPATSRTRSTDGSLAAFRVVRGPDDARSRSRRPRSSA